MSDPAAPKAWEAAVSVREDPVLSGELVGRLSRESGRRAIGVTDLISLRRAYYRAAAPGVPIPEARQARLDQGRTFHRVVGARLGREGLLEARVRTEGIVGRVDILSEVPVEVKTAVSFVEPGSLVTARPDHLEQLGMYCALVGRPAGRLLTLLVRDQGVSDVQALDVPFERPEKVLAEMRARAERLRTAWAAARPDALPRCPWFGRGCEFEAARVCHCTGDEAPESSAILDEAGPIAVREDVRERVRAAVAGPVVSEPPPALSRFREVLYPRRAYFDRTALTPESPPVPETGDQPLPPTRPPDLYARLTEALESGPAGEVARIPPRSEEPEEDVVGFRGRPLLTRTSRAWARFRPEELIARSPQYVLDLGFRCAVTGTDSALLVLGFERAERDADRLQVLEVRFRTLTPFSRRLREQSTALAAALRDHAPGRLEACPEWMVADCPYRSECGCGPSGARSMR